MITTVAEIAAYEGQTVTLRGWVYIASGKG